MPLELPIWNPGSQDSYIGSNFATRHSNQNHFSTLHCLLFQSPSFDDDWTKPRRVPIELCNHNTTWEEDFDPLYFRRLLARLNESWKLRVMQQLKRKSRISRFHLPSPLRSLFVQFEGRGYYYHQRTTILFASQGLTHEWIGDIMAIRDCWLLFGIKRHCVGMSRRTQIACQVSKQRRSIVLFQWRRRKSSAHVVNS